jgi:hypothetical protein
MLKRLTAAEKFAIFLEQYTTAIREAFLASIFDIRESVVLTFFIARIEAHDISGAIRALNIEAPAFNPMLDEIARAYTGGGNNTINDLPPLRGPDGFRINIRFDARNPSAEAWLRDHSAALMREIVDDQVNSIRQALAAGQARGASSRATALDIIGRINKATGQRTGGIIGLTSTQAEWVKAYRAELEAGDSGALTRNLRDRRYDATVRKAFADGKPISAEAVDKMVTAYENRALRYRGEAIARTESLTAMNSGSEEAMRQAIASGKVSATLVDGKWNTTMDGRERDSHAAMDGQVQPWGSSFVSGAGVRLKYPGDPSAPASERCQCRCNRTFIIRKEPRPTLQ